MSGREERKEKGQKGIIKPKERRGERGIALRSGGEFRAKVFVDAGASERACSGGNGGAEGETLARNGEGEEECRRSGDR